MKTFIYFLPLILLASCQQALVPSSFLEKEKLSRFVVEEKEGLSVLMENLEVNNELIIFDVEIRNHSDQFTYIDPTMFYYFSYDEKPADSINTINYSNHYYAMGEQKVARHLEKKIKKRAAGNVALVILGVGLIVADAYMDAKDESKPIMNESQFNKLVKSNALRDAGTAAGLMAIDIATAVNEEKAIKADEDIYYLPEEYLRETVLGPGETCRGKVFFQRGDYLRSHYRFVLPIEEKRFIMNFKKETGKDRRAIRNNLSQ